MSIWASPNEMEKVRLLGQPFPEEWKMEINPTRQSFMERWYGDGCPPWTWPLTALVLACASITLIDLLK